MSTAKEGGAASPEREFEDAADETSNSTEDTLAGELAEEMAGEPETESGETEKPDAADESGSTAEGDEPEAEADSDDLSQATEQTEGAEEAGDEAKGDEPEAELTERVGKIPKLNDEQKSHVTQIIKDRIAAVTEKRREAEERATAAEARIAELESNVTPVRVDGSPLANLATIEQLQAKANSAQQVLDYYDDAMPLLKRNPAAVERQLREMGLKLTNEEGEEDFSRESMEAFLEERRVKASRTLSREIPARAKYLQQEKQHSTKAEELMPWLKKPADERNKKFQEVLKAAPQLKTFPSWKLIVAAAVDRILDFEKPKAAAAPPLAKVTTPKKVNPANIVVSRKGTPAKASAKAGVSSAAQKRFEESGSEKDLAESLANE